MPNSKIILTKTARPNATPHPNDLDYGELAINYEDGLLFFKNASNRISKIASSGSFSQLTRHLADRENPHEVTQAQVGLGKVDNSADLDKPISNAAQTALDNKVNLSTLNTQYYNRTQTDGRITTKFSEIGIQIQEPSATNPAGNLSYDRDSNTFIYTEATIPTINSLGALGSNSVQIQQSTPLIGSGTLIYQGAGIFIYDRPTIGGLGGYAKTQIGLNYKTGDAASDGTLTYNDGFFTYDKPTIAGLTQGKITLTNSVLDVEGFATDSELAEIDQKIDSKVATLNQRDTELDVEITSLQGQISDNDTDIFNIQSDVTDLQSQITDNDADILTLQGDLASANADIASNLGKIQSNDGDISGLNTKVATNTSNITSVTTKANTNASNITNLTTEVGTNKSNIADNLDDINNLRNDKVENIAGVTGIQKLTQSAYDDLPNGVKNAGGILFVIVD